MRRLLFLVWTSLVLGGTATAQQEGVALIVLGTVQDGGLPHIGCQRVCCASPEPEKMAPRHVVCLGLSDPAQGTSYLFEATPNLGVQMDALHRATGLPLPSGIFLTHAHIGHYSGLQFLGREALNAPGIPVYAMPRMSRFLRRNGPWGQLVSAGNIRLAPLKDGKAASLGPNLKVTPVRVPHRDEYSETVGFLIAGPRKTALFIPDIDKWERWETDIEAHIRAVDYAFLDATFFDASEVGYRDISEIPHPFVSESMARFARLPEAEKEKVFFIHMNHTNPLLDPESEASKAVEAAGFHIARQGQVFRL